MFYPKTFTLANGLRFVVVENRLSPAVSQMVWYKVGSADEAPGHSGLAHYLEHLMFRGTAAIPAGEFSRLIATMGGRDNAFTGYDFTAYYENVAADRLGTVMLMEADRMRNLAITPQTAATELKVVLDERQQRTDNDPQGMFAEKVRREEFGRTPYGVPVIGWKNEMEQMTPREAGDFYEHHYAPGNAVVVISGNVNLRDVMRLAAGTFGRVPPRDVPKRRDYPALTGGGETRVVMTDPRVRQSHIRIHIVAPSYAAQKHNEAYALEVLDETLGGGEVGVLYRQLVVEQKIASAVEVFYDPQARGPSDFAIAATPQPGRSLDDLEKALNAALKNLAAKGLDAATVREAKGRLVREAIFARDSLAAPGYAFGKALTTGQTVRGVEAWPERIGRVAAGEVNAALRRLVIDPHRVTGFLLSGAGAQSQEGGVPALDLPPEGGDVR